MITHNLQLSLRMGNRTLMMMGEEDTVGSLRGSSGSG